jgi:hypothetical protein
MHQLEILAPEIVLEELVMLLAIHKQLRGESTRAQSLRIAFLQIMSIVFAVIFGIFTVRAFRIRAGASTTGK